MNGAKRIDAVLLGVCCAAAFALRTLPAWANVFQPDGVVFQGVDAWFHMRVAENLAHAFPARLGLDPYGLIPGGQLVNTGPLLDYLIAFPVWLLGMGSPSQGAIDAIGALTPAALGALTPLPVYWIGRLLLDRVAALAAAAHVAVLPGVFLSYSVLGVADHHITESLCYLLSLGCLITAVQAEETGRRRRWSAAFGLALGLALLNRPGAFSWRSCSRVGRRCRPAWIRRAANPPRGPASCCRGSAWRRCCSADSQPAMGDLTLLALAGSAGMVAAAAGLTLPALRTSRPGIAGWAAPRSRARPCWLP